MLFHQRFQSVTCPLYLLFLAERSQPLCTDVQFGQLGGVGVGGGGRVIYLYDVPVRLKHWASPFSFFVKKEKERL